MALNPNGSITIHTLGDHIDQGMSIKVYCDDCGRSNLLDLEALAEKLGRDHSARAKDLIPRMKCGNCKSKRMSFSVSSGAGWDGTGGHSHS